MLGFLCLSSVPLGCEQGTVWHLAIGSIVLTNGWARANLVYLLPFIQWQSRYLLWSSYHKPPTLLLQDGQANRLKFIAHRIRALKNFGHVFFYPMPLTRCKQGRIPLNTIIKIFPTEFDNCSMPVTPRYMYVSTNIFISSTNQLYGNHFNHAFENFTKTLYQDVKECECK